jgi:hypothetical protein
MLSLAWDNLATLAVALLIGVATARWAFARRAADPTPAPTPESEDEARP